MIGRPTSARSCLSFAAAGAAASATIASAMPSRPVVKLPMPHPLFSDSAGEAGFRQAPSGVEQAEGVVQLEIGEQEQPAAEHQVEHADRPQPLAARAVEAEIEHGRDDDPGAAEA